MKAKLLLLLCLLTTAVSAQKSASVEIGKACPDYTFRDMFNYKSQQARVSDFKGKILILDFYATYCGPCIEQFPKLDSLQHKFDGQIQILLVGYEKKERIQSLFKRIAQLNKSFALPSAVIDTSLFKSFLRKDGSIGGQLIISEQGIVLGRLEEIDSKVIQAMIDKKYTAALKTSDTTKAIDNRLSVQMLKNTAKTIYRSFVRRYDSTSMDRLAYVKFSKTENDYGQLNYWNFTPVQLFASVYGKFNVVKTEDGQTFILSTPYPGYLIKNETKQPAYIRSNDKNVNVYRAKYNYCYDLIMQHADEKQLTDIMKVDLERTFHIKASLIDINVQCLVLKKIGPLVINTQGSKTAYEKDNYGIRLINQPMTTLLDCLSYYLVSEKRWKLIVDESGIKSTIDIAFIAKMNDLKSVNTQLKKYNLELVDAMRPQKGLRLAEVN